MFWSIFNAVDGSRLSGWLKVILIQGDLLILHLNMVGYYFTVWRCFCFPPPISCTRIEKLCDLLVTFIAAKADDQLSFVTQSTYLQVQYFDAWHSGGNISSNGWSYIQYYSKRWITYRSWCSHWGIKRLCSFLIYNWDIFSLSFWFACFTLPSL